MKKIKLSTGNIARNRYTNIKAKYPTTIVFVRSDDNYMTFDQDAITASTILGLILIASSKSVSFHVNSLDLNLNKLVRAAKRVAICDQLTDVKRKLKNLL